MSSEAKAFALIFSLLSSPLLPLSRVGFSSSLLSYIKTHSSFVLETSSLMHICIKIKTIEVFPTSRTMGFIPQVEGIVVTVFRVKSYS